ncbi:MAG: lipase family protein [Pseudonocardiaceae bacterium]
MTKPTVSNISVSGGAGGIEAQYEDLAAMGRLTDDVAEDTLRIAVTSQQYLRNPDVIASAILDPAGAVRFETALLAALDGPHGLTATSAGIGLRGVAFRASAEAYQLSDKFSAKALDTIRWLEGTPIGAIATVGVLAGPTLAEVYGADGGEWQKFLVDHPGTVDQVIGMSPGLLSGLLGRGYTLADTTALLAGLYPDGAPRITDGGIDPNQTPPPQGLGDIIGGLQHRDDPGRGDDNNIDVRKVIGAEGKVSYIVDIPGTRVWNAPGQNTGSANDLGVNLDAMAGNPTVLEKGIQEALGRSHVGPHDPVMLVGHSQGGIVAVRAANDFVTSGQYNVTHVVTAGSPIGRVTVPDNVQVLSLENRNDIVPHLDASNNPDTANRTTVTFDQQTGTMAGNHQIADNYTDVAKRLDDSSDPSVTAYTKGMGDFTSGSQVETYRYKVERQ